MRFRLTHIFGVLVFAATLTALHAQTYAVLYNFGTNTGDPKNPASNGLMTQGRDGNVYSTTSFGGSTGTGAAFKITTSGGLTKLDDFTDSPVGGLSLGFDGNFYGTTSIGGTKNIGTVFKITSTGRLTTLWNFTAADDGAGPLFPPLQGQDGNLYGTDPNVYTGTYGTIYRMTPAGALTALADFSFTNGDSPNLPAQGTDGNFYGATRFGGVNGVGCQIGCGVMYKVNGAGVITVLHSFAGYPTEGSDPLGAMVQGSDGSFYGITNTGGAANLGTVFKITPAGKLTILYNFCSLAGCTDGKNPLTGLAVGTDGNFYGTAEGGAHNAGELFKITPTGQLTVLYSFCNVAGCTDGFFPQTPLIQHTNGKFYGEVESGGTSGLNGGVFFSLDMGLGPFVNILNWSGKVGKTVEILGQGFTGTTRVAFNGKPATFTVSSDTYLTATVPAGATTGFITVATPGASLKSDRKFLVTPSILSFTPTSGPVGTPVTITGSSFTGATVVAFGGVKTTSFTVNSDTQISTTVPTGAKTGKIQVTTPGGTATSSGTFTVM